MADKKQATRLQNGAALLGFAAFLGGVGAFDWRWALIVGGLLLLGGAIYGMRQR